MAQDQPDARVADAAAHWSYRFTANGTDYGDFHRDPEPDHPLG